MNVGVYVNDRAVRRWIIVLLQRIAALPNVTLSVVLLPTPSGVRRREAALLSIGAILGRRSPKGWAELTNDMPAEWLVPTDGYDLVLDLTGNAPVSAGHRVWQLSFQGGTGEGALLSELMAGGTPHVALVEDGHVVASARVGTEAHGNILTVFEDALARTTTLIVAAVRGLKPLTESPPPTSEFATRTNLSVAAIADYAARRTFATLRNGLRKLRYRYPHWRVGWRHLDDRDVIDLGTHPTNGWNDLPDDGSRFYADPFPIDYDGSTILFVEDYEYSRSKAVISAVAFGSDGPIGVPVPVLDEPYHLSYPFVFAQGGDYWMIPESCAAGTVDLYRAHQFPGGWVKEATLLSGLMASDATLVEHSGCWWMLATVRESVPEAGDLAPRGSFSDTLHVWSAPDFRGPWTPHAGNPVLIDIASARSAGRIVSRGSKLIRPVQDCRRGYGAALALARIDRLGDGGYAQTVEAQLEPGPAWPGACLHTLNRSSTYEFIDGAGRVPRWGF